MQARVRKCWNVTGGNVAFKNTSDVIFFLRILRISAKKDFIPKDNFNFSHNSCPSV